MRSLFVYLFVFGFSMMLLLPTALLAQTIGGTTTVCEGECLSYTASGGTAPYTWTVTGGTPTLFVGTNFNICWGTSGSGNITLTDANNATATATVTINPKPTPTIVPPIVPACPAINSGAQPSDNHTNNCQKACANSCALYYVPYTTGSTYVWSASGHVSLTPSGSGNSQATVCWGNVGNGSLKVVETNVFGCQDSTKICINKIPSPTAAFTPGPNITVCQGQTVSFNNTSTGAVSYLWTFGGGSPATSTQTHPTATFSTVGTWTVTLLVQNQCLCSDTATATVTVLPGQGPPIECVSALCAGSNATYSTPPGCGPYTWSITGGTITSGASTPNITVAWGFTPPFTLSLSAGGCGYCPMPTTLNVPIIPLTMPIVGATTPCYGDLATYSLVGNTCGGSYHTWTINPSLGYIVSGQGSQTIMVQWHPAFNNWCSPTPTAISVAYDNCYLDCEHGSGSLNVTLLPEFLAEGPAEGCVGLPATFKAACSFGFPNFTPTLCNWSIITPSNTTIPNVATNTATLNYSGWTTPGTYTVVATAVNPANWCNATYSTTIDIMPLPPAPTNITGPTTVCPNSTYTYQAIASPFVGIFNWTATNGTVVPINGNTVNVTWGASGPYSVSVSQQDINSPNCPSLPFTLNVIKYTPAAPTGLTTVCLDQTTTYSVPSIPGSNYIWSISPSGAGSFLGSTLGNTVTVQWNVVGAATLSLNLCGQTSNQTITVSPTTAISLTPVSYCAGSSATLSAPVSVCAPYVWKNAMNVVIGTGSTVSVSTAGYYSLTATNCSTGCAAIGTVLVTQNPTPVAAITTPDPTDYCGSATINSTLYAQNNPGYTFQWYNGATPVGTGSTYTATTTGAYSVVVTNSFGCTATSNIINITYVPTCPVPCTPVGTVAGLATPTPQCNTWNFSGTATNATITGWTYGNGFSGANPSTYVYPQAGYYTATIYAVDINGCPISMNRLVTVPVAPDFGYTPTCNRLVSFNGNLSTFVSPYSITAYTWNFGDPASGVNNTATGATPTHTFVGLGNTFNVTLTISSSSGCTASIVLPVNVYPQATAIIAPPVAACAGSGISFSGAGSLGTLVGYAWNFGDPGSGAANTSPLVSPSHTYFTGGTYTVTLTVTDIYGCTANTTASVNVASNPLTGTISVSPSAAVCLGTTVTLTAPNPGNTYLWSNGQTTQSISAAASGTYSVTISNANACNYIPPTQTVTVYPAPAVVIEGPTEICEGDEAVLKVSPCSSGYTYAWSNSGAVCATNISNQFSPLPAGSHTFTVTVTSTTAPNCSVVLSHTIQVYPLPAPFTITSSPGGNICEGTTVTFSAPANPAVTYFWNTGQSGNSITVPNASAGGYYAMAIDNITGCETKSNVIEVYPLPDVCMAPQGCYTAVCCDTLCVALDPNITGYQWYFNGLPIVGAVSNTFTTCYDTLGTGVYQVLLTNIWGCSALSPPLNLTILPCDTACAFIVEDSIRCVQSPTGMSFQYGFQLLNNSGFTVNSVQLVGITSTGATPSISPNPMSITPIPNNSSGAAQWFNIGGAGVAAGDTVCFQINVAKMIGTVMDSCCTSPLTHCVILPQCCNCNPEEFQAQVNQGFSIVPTGVCGQYILTPQALGPCDSVEWLISPPLYSVGNSPVLVNLPTGTHYVCMVVTRYDANGNICDIYEKCITIVVPPCCVCDQNFFNQVQLGFSMSTSGYTATLTPLGVFNNNCDIVQWSYTSNAMSVIMGNSVGSNSFNYTFPGSGFYTIYMCVTRTQADGTTCQYCVCRKLWIPPLIISDEDTDILDVAAAQIIAAPHWHGCGKTWIDVTIDLLYETQNGTVSYDPANSGFAYNPNEGFVGTDVFSYLLCIDDGPETQPCDTVTVVLTVGASAPVDVHLQAFLSGGFIPATQTMRTELIADDLLPIEQPFDCAPWFYTGNEGFASISSMPPTMVDYVLVEARPAADINSIAERVAAYILSDGTISNSLMMPDATLPDAVYFSNLSPNGSYYFVLRHQNHLPVVTANPHNTSSPALIDLTQPANILDGSGQLTNLGNGKYGLKSGDISANGVITVADFNIFTPQAAGVNVYTSADCNLDGNVTVADFNQFSSNASAIGVSIVRY